MIAVLHQRTALARVSGSYLLGMTCTFPRKEVRIKRGPGAPWAGETRPQRSIRVHQSANASPRILALTSGIHAKQSTAVRHGTQEFG